MSRLICPRCSHGRFDDDCYGCDPVQLRCCRCHADLIPVRCESVTFGRAVSPASSAGSGHSLDSGVSVPPHTKKKWPSAVLVSFQQEAKSNHVDPSFSNKISELNLPLQRIDSIKYYEAVVSYDAAGYKVLNCRVGDVFTSFRHLRDEKNESSHIWVRDIAGELLMLPRFCLEEISSDQFQYLLRCRNDLTPAYKKTKPDTINMAPVDHSSHTAGVPKTTTGDSQTYFAKRQKISDVCDLCKRRKLPDCNREQPSCSHCRYLGSICLYEQSREEQQIQSSLTESHDTNVTSDLNEIVKHACYVDVSNFLKERALEPVSIVEAKKSYVAQHSEELSIVKGDRIYVLAWDEYCDQINKSEWARVEKDDKVGIVPRCCLGDIDLRQYTPYR